jgi:hypothetical protein
MNHRPLWLLPLFTSLFLNIPSCQAQGTPTPESHQRLASLCRLWGTIKIFHTYLVYRQTRNLLIILYRPHCRFEVHPTIAGIRAGGAGESDRVCERAGQSMMEYSEEPRLWNNVNRGGRTVSIGSYSCCA